MAEIRNRHSKKSAYTLTLSFMSLVIVAPLIGILIRLASQGPPHQKKTYQVTEIPLGNGVMGQIVVDNADDTIYASNNVNNTVAAVNGHSDAVRTISVGSGPYDIAIAKSTDTIYVANSTYSAAPSSGTISAISGHSGTVHTIKLAFTPGAIAVDQATDTIYATNASQTNMLYAINGHSDTISAIRLGKPMISINIGQQIVINQATNTIYVTDPAGNAISAVDSYTDAVHTIQVGKLPGAIAVDQATDTVYVANLVSDTISVINAITDQVQTINEGSQATYALAVDQTTGSVYGLSVSGEKGITGQGNKLNTVFIINGSNGALRTIKVGRSSNLSGAIAVDQASGTVYVMNNASNSLSVINGDTYAVHTIRLPRSPDAMAIDQTTGTVYVASDPSGYISVIKKIHPLTLKGKIHHNKKYF
jgi:YVTN family beta-propeller protein